MPNASLLSMSPLDPPASDIHAGESGGVGEKGSWYIAVEAILDSPFMSRKNLRSFFAIDEDWEWEFNTVRASSRILEVHDDCSKKQRTVGGLPLHVKAQLSEVEQDLRHKGKCSRSGRDASTMDTKDG